MNFFLKKAVIAIIIGAIDFGKNMLIKRFPADWLEIRATVALQFGRMNQFVLIFSDENPRNKEQVQELLQDIFQNDSAKIVRAAVYQGIAKIKDEKAKQIAEAFAFPVVQTVLALTDDEPDNEAQMKLVFQNFIQNPQNSEIAYRNLVVPFLSEKIKDEDTLKFLLSFLKNILVEQK